MQEDPEGFLVPKIDPKKCISCGLCEKVCPQNKTFSSGEVSFLAAYHRDAETRLRSASGGVFPALAQKILQRGGAVCGCVLDDSLQPVHIVSENSDDVKRMQGSKYVQSAMQDCFRQIGALLCASRPVLFSGTSCQVAGLLQCLEQSGISRELLLTVDIVCHGVPSPKLWRAYLSFYERKKHRRVQRYSFRSKDYGWGVRNTQGSYMSIAESAGGRRDRSSLALRLWNAVFDTDWAIRPCCHACPYASVQRKSDITVGDFWGIENVMPEMDDGQGCSCVLLHTKKGQEALTELTDLSELITAPVHVEDITRKNPNLCRPTPEKDGREQFWEDYRTGGFDYLAKKYFHYSPVQVCKHAVKRVLRFLGLRKKL